MLTITSATQTLQKCLALTAALFAVACGSPEMADADAVAALDAELATTLPANTKLSNVYITWYGFNDNSCEIEEDHSCGNLAFPKGDGFPVPHDTATEGTGAFDSPITFATAARDSGSPAEFAPGTKIYVPLVRKYFVMEDQCAECGTEWFGSKKSYHVDLWMGPSALSADAPLMACEERLTIGRPNRGTGVIIVNPPSSLPVDTNPIFKNDTCTAHTYPNQ